MSVSSFSFVCFCYVSAPAQIYTLSLHDALPIYDGFFFTDPGRPGAGTSDGKVFYADRTFHIGLAADSFCRSEEHTSELQSRVDLVCRLLLEKKKNIMM